MEEFQFRRRLKLEAKVEKTLFRGRGYIHGDKIIDYTLFLCILTFSIFFNDIFIIGIQYFWNIHVSSYSKSIFQSSILILFRNSTCPINIIFKLYVSIFMESFFFCLKSRFREYHIWKSVTYMCTWIPQERWRNDVHDTNDNGYKIFLFYFKHLVKYSWNFNL